MDRKYRFPSNKIHSRMILPLLLVTPAPSLAPTCTHYAITHTCHQSPSSASNTYKPASYTLHCLLLTRANWSIGRSIYLSYPPLCYSLYGRSCWIPVCSHKKPVRESFPYFKYLATYWCLCGCCGALYMHWTDPFPSSHLLFYKYSPIDKSFLQ